MKIIRNLSILVLMLMSASVIAGPLVIKDGDVEITSGKYVMDKVIQVGDDASRATLLVDTRNVSGSLSLRQSGNSEISVVWNQPELHLTFIPTDSAGVYTKTIYLEGLDADENPISEKLEISALCEWGKMRLYAFPANVNEGYSSQYFIEIDQTSYYGFKDINIEAFVGGEDGLKIDDASIEFDLTDGMNRAMLLSDNNTLLFNSGELFAMMNGSENPIGMELPNPGGDGKYYYKISFTNERGDKVSTYKTIEPGLIVEVNTANNTAIQGFDLSSCFDEETEAVFDTLYLLTNSICAVYTRLYDDVFNMYVGYEFATSYNPSTQKRILDNADGKKLYFTGRCDHAYTGDANVMSEDQVGILTYYSLDGAFNLLGGGGNKTDVYLENLFIETIDRSGGSCNNGLNFMYRDMPGGSIVFAIISSAQGTGSYYDVNFHSKGTNLLRSNKGVNFYLDFLGLATVESDGFTFGSAPISVRESTNLGMGDMADVLAGTAEISKTNARLNFDDYWFDGTSQNGLLELDINGQVNVGSIDLGNEFTQCNFYGGRYKLGSGATRRNSVVHLNPVEQYKTLEMFLDYFLSNSMAICYRMFAIDIYVRAFGVTVPIRMCGFGNDMVGYGQVNFWGGTFETYGVDDDYMSETNQKYEYCYFRDRYDLRIPDGSQVNGGTFNNCNVYLCDTVSSRGVNPINALGDTVCRAPIEITGLNADGTAQFTIPSEITYDIEGMGTFAYNDIYGLDMLINGANAFNATPKHGMTADEDNNVNVYLPCELADLEPVVPIKNKIWWNMVMPAYSANKDGGTTITSDGSVYNCYFADVILDTLVYNKGQVITINFGGFRGELYNKENSEIQKRLYIIMPVESNRWYNFMAPFDISNVYVVNTQKVPETLNSSTWKTYRNQLRDNNYNLIIGFAPQLIFGAHLDLLELVESVGDTLLRAKGKDFSIDQVYPYLGNNPDESHFYLYQPYDSVLDATEKWRYYSRDISFIEYEIKYLQENNLTIISDSLYYALDANYQTLKAAGELPQITDFSMQWKYVEPVVKHFEDENGDGAIDAHVIMEAKHVYGLNFPGNQAYPYWNNRYLIFEGYGKQTVYGSDEQANFVTSASAGQGQWGGNYSYVPYRAKDNFFVLDSRYNNKSDYVKAAEVADLVEGVSTSQVEVENDWGGTDTEYFTSIDPHFAYLVSNAKTSISNRYTGMTNGEDVSGEAPTINEVSFLVYENEGINIETNYNQTMRVYDMQGKLVFSRAMLEGNGIHLALPAGTYIIAGETDNVKISIR